MPRDRKDIEAGLKNKGFRKKDGDHHYFIYYSSDDKKSLAKTKTSHAMKSISNDLLSKMSQQCFLSKAEFLNLVDCPLTREEYETILRRKEKL